MNDAIRIRIGTREPNWREYELARAVCRIHLDVQFNEQPKQKSASEVQQAVLLDLEKGKDVPLDERKLIDRDDVITAWQALNRQSGPGSES